MYGGAGDDFYFVNSLNDTVSELNIVGNDTVSASVNWTLGANLETLILSTSSGLSGFGNSATT